MSDLLTIPMTRMRPPGAVKDCVTCIRWTPGTIVLRGNTLGSCPLYPRQVGADEWCNRHEEKPDA